MKETFKVESGVWSGSKIIAGMFGRGKTVKSVRGAEAPKAAMELAMSRKRCSVFPVASTIFAPE